MLVFTQIKKVWLIKTQREDDNYVEGQFIPSWDEDEASSVFVSSFLLSDYLVKIYLNFLTSF